LAGGGDGWMAAPALAEAGQGRLEIILGDGNGTLRGLDDRGRERWCYQFGRPIGDPPTAGDVDGDGRLEVLAGFDDDGTVLCLEERPAVDWQFRADFRVVSSPTLADLDGDGRVEVLVTSNDHALYCLRPVGRRGGRLPWPRRAHDNQQTGAWQGGRP